MRSSGTARAQGQSGKPEEDGAEVQVEPTRPQGGGSVDGSLNAVGALGCFAREQLAWTFVSGHMSEYVSEIR
jgi:hypothetical protein